ncbi:MAG TPA: ABC transporter permease [Streptosporangiaceae bacterium]
MSMILTGEPAGTAQDPEESAAGGSAWRMILSVFVQNRLAILGVTIVIAMVCFSFLGPLFYHTDQVHTNLAEVNLPPGPGHPLGTDNVGYDVLGRLMVSGQSSLIVGLAAALLATVVGTLWGAIAGYAGGPVDTVMMRIVDSVLAIPPLILILLLATVLKPNTWVLILVVAIVAWLAPARLVRGEALSLRTREYVQAATAMGGRRGWIVLRHVTPNAIGTIVVQATFEVANAILLLAALSYLGLGPAPPATNWGSMLSDGLNYMYEGKWWLIYPAGIAIVLTVVAFNFIGDALRAALEVRLQVR